MDGNTIPCIAFFVCVDILTMSGWIDIRTGPGRDERTAFIGSKVLNLSV